MIQVHHLFVSPGHNYFGHNGQPAGSHPVLEVDQVECVAGRGLMGDRFFDFKADYKGQVTFFSREVFAQVCGELGLQNVSPAVTRRNVLVSGADLNGMVGTEFEIQGIRFLGVEECRPCHWMNQAFHHDQAETRLKGRGGLRARILSTGTLRRDA
ncbi:MAG TPA: MOSC domain-containing protein [Clostridia bacterium]|nr:MOSC domain-containing protein [Clostridia bacterium]